MNCYRAPGSHFSMDREGLSELFEQMRNGYYKIEVEQVSNLEVMVTFRPQAEWLGEPVSFNLSLAGQKGDKGDKGDKGEPGQNGTGSPEELSEYYSYSFVSCAMTTNGSVAKNRSIVGIPGSAKVVICDSVRINGSTVNTTNSVEITPSEIENYDGKFAIIEYYNTDTKRECMKVGKLDLSGDVFLYTETQDRYRIGIKTLMGFNKKFGGEGGAPQKIITHQGLAYSIGDFYNFGAGWTQCYSASKFGSGIPFANIANYVVE